MSNRKRPAFTELPLRDGDPPFSAWGLYGPNDQLGTLNILTPEVVAEAAREIQTGVRIGLDLPLDYLGTPSAGRVPVRHEIFSRGVGRPVHDDVLEFNTQCSSQWDGFGHAGYMQEKLFYNGVTGQEIIKPGSKARLGIHAWCKQGIAGRGVLLDFLGWSEANEKPYELLSDYSIPVEDLKACAEWQKTTLKEGDILLIRSGWKVAYDALGKEEQEAWCKMSPMKWVGVERSIKTVEWLWDTGFSACAGDAPGWERVPHLDGPAEEGGLEMLSLHQVMLAGWGMPIGEYFNLEELVEECRRQGRYSFFIASMPLHVVGGVGSPPNIMAIF
ncbi:hypothetical protein FE257_010695 [Aspergillus nanangensis]|uniref:Cyclase family protein n=1 Tax=Aspergillus nanangensis TaxID=2582783 RepID=A0AAD4CI39_ASPNN|nr:hypothetical protein FE257_010695 [Aspergillus nanangensis]